MSQLVDPRAALAGTTDTDAMILVHGIRNQLTSVGGIVQLISRNELRCGTHDSFALAQQMLELALVKLELLRKVVPGANTATERSDVECGNLISRLCRSFSLLASRHGARLSCETVTKPVHVKIDSLALSRALSTLIVLSITHFGAKEIEVCLRTAEPGIALLVRDDASALRGRMVDTFLALQSGRSGPVDPLHHELLTCIRAAADASARLRLIESWSHGVCWELALPIGGIADDC